ncbi:MAG: hypothetical protein ACFFAU_00960 [Candidatus Hodarchaeota archaeon]
MKQCPKCKTELSLLGLLYKGKYPHYVCSKCNIDYLEVPTFGGKTIIVGREFHETVIKVIEENREVLKMLAEYDGHPREDKCICGDMGWIYSWKFHRWIACADCNDDEHIPKPKWIE